MLVVAGSAAALPVTLTLVPSSLVLTAGQNLTVDIVIGGLDDDGEIALESFDLDLSFGTTRLQFTSLTFGSSLGTVVQSSRNGPGTPNTTGVVVMEEFSFLTEASLLALQSAPFTLATLTFTALDNPGNVVLQLINLASSSLGGVAGAALGDDLQTPNSLQVWIVPEPATALLGAAGLALFGLWARSTRD
jgi:hypothetical protein